MIVVLQHPRPQVINLLSGKTLRLDAIGQQATVSEDDSQSPELLVALQRGKLGKVEPEPAAKPAKNNKDAT